MSIVVINVNQPIITSWTFLMWPAILLLTNVVLKHQKLYKNCNQLIVANIWSYFLSSHQLALLLLSSLMCEAAKTTNNLSHLHPYRHKDISIIYPIIPCFDLTITTDTTQHKSLELKTKCLLLVPLFITPACPAGSSTSSDLCGQLRESSRLFLLEFSCHGWNKVNGWNKSKQTVSGMLQPPT